MHLDTSSKSIRLGMALLLSGSLLIPLQGQTNPALNNLATVAEPRPNLYNGRNPTDNVDANSTASEGYPATVLCGTASGEYKSGDTVTITANPPSTGESFNQWVVDVGEIQLANASDASTSFQMPASPVTIRATYKPIYGGTLFKLILIGDTQKLANKYPGTFNQMTQWIADNATSNGIAYVLHMGDLTEDSIDGNWDIAQTAMRKLDHKIHYAVTVGNNDLIDDSNAIKFNEHFPLDYYKNTSGFVSNFDRYSNSAHLFSAGGLDWLIVSLRHDPDPEAMKWAENLLAKNPDKKVIILSHSFLSGTVSSPKITGDGGTTIWNTVKKYSNVMFIFCGHNGNTRKVLTGDNGNTVFAVLTNFQGLLNVSYMNFVELDTLSRTVKFNYFSPFTNKSLDKWEWAGVNF